MISLARHIELLLLEHDCVIVPGFGGFIASHAEARFTGEDEHLYLPPYRTIAFNQQLQINDGVLVQSYMTAYDASYPSANLQMEKDIEKMMNELDLNGSFELENLGTLKKGINQNVTFVAPETGALTPSLYGLYSYEIKSLSRVIKEREIEQSIQAAAAAMQVAVTPEPAPTEKKTTQKSHSKEFVIRLNRHWLDFGIAAAAAIVLFFCISYPALKTAHNDSDTVVASFTPVKDIIAHHAPTATPAATQAKDEPTATKAEVKVENKKESLEDKATTTDAKSINKEDVAKVKVEEKSPIAQPASAKAEVKTETIQPQVKTAKGGKYTLVLASYVNEENANLFIQRLSKEGLKDARFVKDGKVSRILYSGYANEAQAQKALNSLRQKNSAFAEAWVLAL